MLFRPLWDTIGCVSLWHLSLHPLKFFFLLILLCYTPIFLNMSSILLRLSLLPLCLTCSSLKGLFCRCFVTCYRSIKHSIEILQLPQLFFLQSIEFLSLCLNGEAIDVTMRNEFSKKDLLLEVCGNWVGVFIQLHPFLFRDKISTKGTTPDESMCL